MPDYNMLFQAPNPGASAIQGFQQGAQLRQNQQLMREHQEDRQFKMSQMQAEQRAQQLQQAREQLQMTARLLDHATDPVSYAQARQAAAGIPGFDLSQVPEQYDPNWVAQTKMQVQALNGQVEQELMAVAPGTVVINKQTGEQVFKNPDKPRYYALPPGGRLELDPSYNGPGAPPQDAPSGGPAIGTVEDGYRFKGGNPADPNSWEPVGGSGGNVGGGFPGPH